MTKVLIAAPLRQDPKIFEEYQKGLDALIIPEGVIADRYFVVNDCDNVIPYIRNAEYDVVNNGWCFKTLGYSMTQYTTIYVMVNWMPLKRRS